MQAQFYQNTLKLNCEGLKGKTKEIHHRLGVNQFLFEIHYGLQLVEIAYSSIINSKLWRLNRTLYPAVSFVKY